MAAKLIALNSRQDTLNAHLRFLGYSEKGLFILLSLRVYFLHSGVFVEVHLGVCGYDILRLDYQQQATDSEVL